MKDKKKLLSFIKERLDRLEKKCSYEDLQEIKLVTSKIWRKYHPLEEITALP